MLSAYRIAGSNELYYDFKIVCIASRLSLLGRNRLQWFDTSRQDRPRDSSDNTRLQATAWRMWLLWIVVERTDQYDGRSEERGISELKNSSLRTGVPTTCLYVDDTDEPILHSPPKSAWSFDRRNERRLKICGTLHDKSLHSKIILSWARVCTTAN